MLALPLPDFAAAFLDATWLVVLNDETTALVSRRSEDRGESPTMSVDGGPEML
jgi:hypothetical protein